MRMPAGAAADGEEVEGFPICGFDWKVVDPGFGHAAVGGDPPPHDEGEASEEPFDEGLGDPLAKSEGVDSHDSSDALEPLFVVAKRFAAGRDTQHLDGFKSRLEQSLELAGLVFMEMKGILTVGIRAVGRRDERGALISQV